ncbi:hypothetical protein KSC_022790 [Ktedonobacter sp. SOSP1-52]|nr:hypothetical protein KSC_022790 [Ktedonobacter sp. SOSP1-52]
MLHEGLGDLSNLLQGAWTLDLEAFLSIRPMIPFNKGIFVWAMRWTDVGVDPQTEQQAAEGPGQSHLNKLSNNKGKEEEVIK